MQVGAVQGLVRACIVHLGAAAAELRSAIEAARNGNEQGENDDDDVVCRSKPSPAGSRRRRRCRREGERGRESFYGGLGASCGRRAVAVTTKWPRGRCRSLLLCRGTARRGATVGGFAS